MQKLVYKMLTPGPLCTRFYSPRGNWHSHICCATKVRTEQLNLNLLEQNHVHLWFTLLRCRIRTFLSLIHLPCFRDDCQIGRFLLFWGSWGCCAFIQWKYKHSAPSIYFIFLPFLPITWHQIIPTRGENLQTHELQVHVFITSASFSCSLQVFKMFTNIVLWHFVCK